ncbi:hypothetical protein AB0395_27065 [Streptosporangium sp. NPDC051023]|uniref:hypothetical protein n=1 Tax=Streptosporangium sp. NPDC051023 TaxID=3155410 RepID=UPI00344DE09B
MTPLPPEPLSARIARAPSRHARRNLLHAIGAALAIVMAMTPWIEAIAPSAARAMSAACVGMSAHHGESGLHEGLTHHGKSTHHEKSGHHAESARDEGETRHEERPGAADVPPGIGVAEAGPEGRRDGSAGAWADAPEGGRSHALPDDRAATTDTDGRESTGADETTDPTTVDESTGETTGLTTGLLAVTALDDGQCTFENDSREVKDDLTDVGTTESRLRARGVVVAIHRTGPSETSPKSSDARGPPVRAERLRAGVPHTHRLRPNTAGGDRPRPCEDRSDARTSRPEDP